MLGYKRGIVVSVVISVGATIFAIQKGLPGSYLYLPPFLAAALLGVWISRRTLRVRKWLPLAIMVVFAAVYGGPLLLTYVANGQQDECSFGPVSNVQYRDYLRRAKELSSNTPGSFSRNNMEARARFNELFERLIDGKPSIYERVAASHALLRSFGAQYRNTSDMRLADPYATVAKTGGFLSFNYYLDVNRLGIFQPIVRKAWIVASLTGPGDFYKGLVPSIAGDIRFVVNYPTLDPLPAIVHASEHCPPVPNQAVAEKFSRIER